jgi:cytolysin-activating lysine-acyltransferase
MFSWSKKPAGEAGAQSTAAANLADNPTPLVKLLGEAPPAASPNLMGMKSQPASPPPQAASSKTPNGNPPPGSPPAGGAGKGDETIFKHAPPTRSDRRAFLHARRESAAPGKLHAKKVSEVLGEIVWLMSQSPLHKQFFIADLEWFVMTPVLLQQFRLFYAKDRPMGVVLWAFVDDDTAGRLAAGTNKLRPQDWKSGNTLWAVEVIAPFGGADEMLKDLKAKVFPTREVRYVAVSADGKKDVRVV